MKNSNSLGIISGTDIFGACAEEAGFTKPEDQPSLIPVYDNVVPVSLPQPDQAEGFIGTLKHGDPRVGLTLVTVGLVSFGMVMIFGVSAATGGEVGWSLAIKQFMSIVVGLIGLAVARKIGYQRLVRMKWFLMAAAVAVLVAVLVPSVGSKINGARRWFTLGPVSVQPSEFAKLALIVFLADFIASKRHKAAEFWGSFLPASIAIMVICGLVQAEPDFGNAVLTGAVGFSMLFVAGIRLLYIAAVTGAAIPALYFAVINVPYRMQRLVAFLDPWADPRGAGYHSIQSLIAVGSGGFFGVGLGRSAAKLQYLPSAYSDFIFAIVGEETGHLGCLVLTGLLIAFLWYAIRVCREAVDDTGFLLAFGIATAIVLQAVINIAVVTACMPAKGLPLPFVSFGGSNLVASMVAVGILISISDRSRSRSDGESCPPRS